MSLNRKHFIIIGLLALIGVLALFYFTGKNIENEQEPKTEQEGGAAAVNNPIESGQIGEVIVKDQETKEEKPLVTPELPLSIFSTTGHILKIGDDYILVMGKGNNFADNQAREITCFFDDKTITFSKDQARHQGLDGLTILKEQMLVSLASRENMRGKTEFTIKTISIK